MAKGTLNKVLLIGRLGKDPEIRHTKDGNAVATFSVATNESWRDKEGNQQERTDWHNCVAFGATAEKYIEPYVTKGTLVCYAPYIAWMQYNIIMISKGKAEEVFDTIGKVS